MSSKHNNNSAQMETTETLPPMESMGTIADGATVQISKEGMAVIVAPPLIYEAAKNDEKRAQIKEAKGKAWAFNSKEFPISYYATQTKKGSFWGDLFASIWESKNRKGYVQIDGINQSLAEGAPEGTQPQPKQYAIDIPTFNAVFYEQILPDVIAAGAQVRAEAVEKKQVMRPAFVRFIAE